MSGVVCCGKGWSGLVSACFGVVWWVWGGLWRSVLVLEWSGEVWGGPNSFLHVSACFGMVWGGLGGMGSLLHA